MIDACSTQVHAAPGPTRVAESELNFNDMDANEFKRLKHNAYSRAYHAGLRKFIALGHDKADAKVRAHQSARGAVALFVDTAATDVN